MNLSRIKFQLFSYNKAQPLSLITKTKNELKQKVQDKDLKFWESRKRHLTRLELCASGNDSFLKYQTNTKVPDTTTDWVEASQTLMLDICTQLRINGPMTEETLLEKIQVPKRLGVKNFTKKNVLTNFCKQRFKVFNVSDDGLINYAQAANSKWFQIFDHEKMNEYKDHVQIGFANRHQPQSGWEWE